MSSTFSSHDLIDAFLEADGNGYLLVREASKKFMTENGAVPALVNRK